MKKKTHSKIKLLSALFAVFFAIISLFSLTTPVLAVPTNAETTQEATKAPESTTPTTSTTSTTDTCSEQAGTVAWIVCPVTKAIAGAIDGLYSVIDNIIVVEPFSSDSDSPIHLVWSYARDITNTVFIIILLIVIYSQLTGLGINNFGIKRTLPRLIISAILVNVSWYVCALAIDASNIIGVSLRGLFTNIKEIALAAGTIPSNININWSSILGVVVSGGVIAGLSIAAANGLGAFFWMLVPTLLGALIAVAAGLITIAARQAIVALLVMISPLAFVAYIIPNTEKWFEKWKQTLYKMLIFFPMFSFLYGASDLIGWTIITSAIHGTDLDAFGLILGMAVQVFPLFFGFSLMKMSGTVLSSVNNAVRKMSAPIQRGVGRFSDTQRELKRQKYLGGEAKSYQLSRRLSQKMSDLNYRRAAEAKSYEDVVKARGAVAAADYKNRRGVASRRGERMYTNTIRSIEYQNALAHITGDLDNGLGAHAGSKRQQERLSTADERIIAASDRTVYEQERNAKIAYENAGERFKRIRRATMSHVDPNAIVEGETIGAADHTRYGEMLSVMDGKHEDTLFIDAGAAYGFSAQSRITTSKFSELFNSAAPTQQLVDILQSLTKTKDAYKYIDSITSGLRALNMRGDTDLTTEQVSEITRQITSDLTNNGGIQLGTHASQALASFCMFDVKDNDPFLRRFGKFINLETAHVYNRVDGREPRHNLNVTLDEYITGQYIETDDNQKPLTNPDGSYVMKSVNKDMVTLLKGTPFDRVERTAYDNMVQSIRHAYTAPDGTVDFAAFRNKMEQVNTSILPNVIGNALTYASGSEQITSFAQYLTGVKPAKDGGWKLLWNDSSDKSYYGMPMEYFLGLTESYIKAQVPNQVANLKSDVFGNVCTLFRTQAAIDYQKKSGVTQENKLDEFIAEAGFDLSIKKSDNPEDQKRVKEASKKVDEFYDNLTSEKDGTVGAIERFRNSLGDNVYERLKRSARTGSLNNTKGPVGQWLGVFDGLSDNNKKTKQQPEQPEEQLEETAVEHQFTDSMRQNITGHLMDLQSRISSNPDDYYEQAYNILENYHLNDIARDFADYYEGSTTTTTADLHNYLLDLINNA